MCVQTETLSGVTVSAAVPAPRKPASVIDGRPFARHEGTDAPPHMVTRLLVEPPDGPVASRPAGQETNTGSLAIHAVPKHRHACLWPPTQHLTPCATLRSRRLKPKGLRVRRDARDMRTPSPPLDAITRPSKDNEPPQLARLKVRPSVVDETDTQPEMGRVGPTRQVSMAPVERRRMAVTPSGSKPVIPRRASAELSPEMAIGLQQGERRPHKRIRLAAIRFDRSQATTLGIAQRLPEDRLTTLDASERLLQDNPATPLVPVTYPDTGVRRVKTTRKMDTLRVPVQPTCPPSDETETGLGPAPCQVAAVRCGTEPP